MITVMVAYRVLLLGILSCTVATYIVARCVQVQTSKTEDGIIDTVDSVSVRRIDAGKAIAFQGKMAIDVDGSPRAYGPGDSGIDYLEYAGHDTDWWGVEARNGRPVLQAEGDPYPNKYYISTTSLATGGGSQRCYVDAEKVPYFVLPVKRFRDWGIRLGDIGWVYNPRTKKSAFGVFADSGPSVGEASIFLGQCVGVHCGIEPKVWGMGRNIIYVVFPHSGKGQGTIPTIDEIDRIGEAKLAAIGGENTILSANYWQLGDGQSGHARGK